MPRYLWEARRCVADEMRMRYIGLPGSRTERQRSLASVIPGGQTMTHGRFKSRRDVLKLAGGAASLAALGTIGASPACAGAPMLGGARPSIYRFKLGSFEITNILD